MLAMVFERLVVLDETAELPEPSLTPATNATLTLSMRQPLTLNPLLNQDVTVDRVLAMVFERLVVLDETQKPVPNLAESFHLASDGKSAVITLKAGLTWQDGTSITADDVVYSLQTIQKAEDTAVYAHVLDNVAGFEAVDTRTVTIHYNQTDSGWAYALNFPIIPKRYYSQNSDADMQPVGSGAYQVENYTLAKSLTLLASPTSALRHPTPAIARVEVLITPDLPTDLHAFNENIIGAVDTTVAEWGKYRGAKEAQVVSYTNNVYDFIGFNFLNPVLQNKQIRQAVAHAVNVQDMVETIYLSQAVRTYSPICPDSYLYKADTAVYDFDLSLAELLLKESGVTQLLPLVILVNDDNPERIKIAEQLKDNLNRINLKAEVSAQPFDTYVHMLETGMYDLFIGGFYMGDAPDLNFAFHSGATPNNGGQNVFRYANPTMDALITQVETATTDSAYKQAMWEMQEFFADDLPCVSLVYGKSALLLDPNIQGEIKPLNKQVLAQVYQWVMME